MKGSPIRSVQDCALLVSANQHFEQLYWQQPQRCLALHIARNYFLLQQQRSNNDYQQQWQDKAKLWWEVYWQQYGNKSNRANAATLPALFEATISNC